MILVRRTLYDFHCLYFSPEVMVKFMRRATGYFVTLITCISGHISPVLRLHNGKKNEILTAD